MIKAARERAGMNQRELGQAVGYNEEQISSIERGQRTPQPDFLATVDELLRCGGLLALLGEDAEQAKARRRVRHPEWFRDLCGVGGRCGRTVLIRQPGRADRQLR
ncbi:helix-turn-helix transcriptional regulator [Streptomyces alboflavus]|uniref:helix-turn-helix domain-containing protein n=1 Tax=Streptomyces alboflavus TaxID=67267 RepID=UPI0031F9D290